jgi:hypothetical protein
VPEGSADDSTRKREFYDATYAYLNCAGVPDLNLARP